MLKSLSILCCIGSLVGCGSEVILTSNEVTAATVKSHQQTASQVDLNDQQDFVDAKRGLVALEDSLQVKDSDDQTIWNMTDYRFVQGAAPDTVNPSLWRQAKLNNIRGLFKVTDRIYQVRGFDFANMTIIEGDTGWIIVDPLTAKETATAALAFAQKHLGVHPIKAVILTHAHMDHFGGVLGVVSPEQIIAKNIRVIAPSYFMEAATSENIIAGTAMARRSVFMYGKNLPRNATGHVGSGLGTGPAFGSFGIVKPTELITEELTTKNIDGLEFVFQDASGTESVAEITFYLPQLKAFCGAELVSRNMHNLYTLRGAQVRNATKWSSKIDQALQQFGHADLYFGSHHWPVWGNDNVRTFLTNQRDLYKYIHDQSVRMLNQGLTGVEIAEQIKLPPALTRYFANRGYYGSLSHNAKAVYQYYMGWFDANPAHLNPIPPSQAAIRYVEMMGGAATVITKAQNYYDQGDYRWVAQVINHVVFADPDNQSAKVLLAKSYDQLGYQAESAPWRNFYLTGAQELRNGIAKKGIDLTQMTDILRNTSVDKFFESMAVRLNSDKAADLDLTIKITFSGLKQSYLLQVKNSVLRHYPAREDSTAETAGTITITHPLFIKMLIGQAGIKDTLFSDELTTDGSVLDIIKFLRLFEKPDGQFNIVTP
ncbi:MAG: MBL fold metallo-hydrolase [Gammaproteobacteria bacterium]|nr:MBL fold metallo-hydrolase [Gammaproteobacteria bacterium]